MGKLIIMALFTIIADEGQVAPFTWDDTLLSNFSNDTETFDQTEIQII